MQDRAANFASKVENFQLEIAEDMNDIKMRVDAVREKIEQNRGSDQNFCGFLLGEADDYLVSFDDKITLLDTRLAQDKVYWLAESKHMEKNKVRQTDYLMKIISKAK